MASDLPPTFVPGFHDEDAVRKMRYNDFGKTGLKVSHLGLGGATFSHLFGQFSEEEAIITIREAFRRGINYIDTAPWYGQGRSEEVIGKALKGVPRQAYYIGTKVGRYEIDPRKQFDFTKEKTRDSINKSLHLLDLPYVDLIQIHDCDFASSPDFIINETLPTLKEAVDAGKARFIGITGYTLSFLKEVVERSKVEVHTVLNYARDTLIDNSLQKFIPYFQSKNLGIISAAGPVMGLLTSVGPQEWHPASAEVKEICKQASDYCKSKDVELGRLAVYHALTRNGQSTHLVGINNRELLQANISLLTDGLTAQEERVFEEIKERFFSRLSQGHWEGQEQANHRAALKKLQNK